MKKKQPEKPSTGSLKKYRIKMTPEIKKYLAEESKKTGLSKQELLAQVLAREMIVRRGEYMTVGCE